MGVRRKMGRDLHKDTYIIMVYNYMREREREWFAYMAAYFLYSCSG